MVHAEKAEAVGRGRRCPGRLAWWLGLAVAASAWANDAQVVFHCQSVRLHPATTQHLGLTYGLEVTTLDGGAINDEIGVTDDETFPYWYGTTLVFSDPTWGEPMWIWCGLDVPDPPDGNWNGISDFFEVDRAVDGIESTGEFVVPDGYDTPGLLDLTWDRAAGSTTGTCRLVLEIPDYGIRLTFKHEFEVFDYRGTLTYTPGLTDIAGVIRLTRHGASGTLEGVLPLTRVDIYELTYEATGWTNELGDVLELYSSDELELSILRGGMRTNYFGVFATDDGLPSTPGFPEYEIWVFHVFDANDWDGDFVSDLTDDPPPPRLAVRQAEGLVALEIGGAVGQSVTVESAVTLPAGGWVPVETLVLTNATQVLDVDLAGRPQTFWRARTP